MVEGCDQVCVCVCDGGFRIGSGKGKERGCCQSSLKVSAIICLVGVCCALLCIVFVHEGS